MKQRITLLLLLLSIGLSAQTVFVKAGSLGLNNGTSWLNAYSSLDLALTAATVGQEIWVAAGTYKPSGVAPNNSFYVPSGVKLYGGFAGTETALSQRNVIANSTILSGDILGNDIAGNFTQNRADNTQHVVVGFVLTANSGLTIDGFTISGGHTLVGTANTDVTRRGGGMLLNAKGTISNCTFTGNYGESGAALAILDAQTDGVLVENCLFEANNAVEDAVCFIRNTPTGSVKNCIFRKNNTKRGCLYPANTTNFLIDGCLFESNRSVSTTATKNFGAGMFTWQATFTLSNSTFRKNKADNAAGIYIDGRDGGDLATIRGCLFEQDTVTDFGGAGIYAWQATMDIHTTTFKANFGPNACGMYADGREFDSSFSIDSCTFDANVATSYGCSSIWNAQTNFTISNTTFKNNIAPSSGPALYNSENCEFTVSNCVFDGNKANFAGAVANYGLNCVGNYVGCTFKNNVATGGGGAASNGFKANVGYVNCEFNANTAASGGAVFTQNDTTQLTIADCYFTGNVASGSGGCVSIAQNVPASVTGSTFISNEGDFGGAINATGDSLLTIDKCLFIENVASTQAGAINLSHANCEITNTLFARNINVSANAGGAISNNAAAGETSKLKAVNCTFAENIAAIGAGIAQWEETGGDPATAQLTLLNCLFQNPDYDNYGIEAGEPEVFSLNGNQSGDATLTTYLTESKDLHAVVNEFQDVNANNYAHTLASPASDGGVSAGAPSDDILGVSRAGVPDVGYREVKTSGINNPGVLVLDMQCVPNPVVDQTILTLKNDRTGRVQIRIWNQLGQQVAQFSTEKMANEFRYPVNVSQYAAGTYTVQVRLGAIVHEGMFVKF